VRRQGRNASALFVCAQASPARKGAGGFAPLCPRTDELGACLRLSWLWPSSLSRARRSWWDVLPVLHLLANPTVEVTTGAAADPASLCIFQWPQVRWWWRWPRDLST